MTRVLVTGGAGYVGSLLVPTLLKKGYKVRVLDNLMYTGLGMLPNFLDPNFEFVRGSVLDDQVLRAGLRDVDIVIPLAALVGYPACKKNPELARSVNCEAIKLLVSTMSKEQKLIFPSTTSCYGEVFHSICTEETPLAPISVYAQTKAEAEKVVLAREGSIVYRFATAFGLSPRLRLDLLINDFVYQAVRNKQLIIYERDFQRCFIHVQDIAKAFLLGLDNFEKMAGKVFNVGSPNLNLTKEQVALAIKKKVNFLLGFADSTGHDEDNRNYYVSFDRIGKLGFKCDIDLDKGVEELIRGIDVVEIKNPFSNV